MSQLEPKSTTSTQVTGCYTKIIWYIGRSHFQIYEKFTEILGKQIEQCNNTFNGEKLSQIGLNIKNYYHNKSKV